MRQWLISADGTRLVQVQQDRLVVNWRKIAEEDAYPRYGILRDELRRVAEAFQAYLVDVTDSAFPPVTQTEITYVNRIPIGGLVGGLSDIGAVVSGANLSWGSHLGAPEQLHLEQRFRFMEPGSPPSRIYLLLQPAPDGEALILNLTMRGSPAGKDMADALTHLDSAHQHLVRGFAAMTTAAAHATWRGESASDAS